MCDDVHGETGENLLRLLLRESDEVGWRTEAMIGAARSVFEMLDSNNGV